MIHNSTELITVLNVLLSVFFIEKTNIVCYNYIVNSEINSEVLYDIP